MNIDLTKMHSILLVFMTLFMMLTLPIPASATSNSTSKDLEAQLAVLATDSTNETALKQAGLLCLNLADYEQAYTLGHKLLVLGESDKHRKNARLYGHIITGQASIMTGKSAQAYQHLLTAQKLATEQRNDSALASAENGLGIYTQNVLNDLPLALHHYYAGLKAAKRIKAKRISYILLANISGVYILRNDTTGLKFARECYIQGKKENDNYVTYLGANIQAYFCAFHNDYNRGLFYAKEAEKQIKLGNIHERTAFYVLYARLQVESGNLEQAKQSLQKAIEAHDGNSSYLIDAYVNLAWIELEQNKLNESKSTLQQALDLSFVHERPLQRAEIYHLLGRCAQQEHNLPEALRYEQLYSAVRDSVFKLESERMLSQAQSRYDWERINNELAIQRVKVSAKQRTTYALIAVGLVILILAIVLAVSNLRLRQLYRSIVNQQRGSLRTEDELRARIIQLEAEGSKTRPLLNEKQRQNIINELEMLMQEEHLFTDPLLTREKVAERLGTNTSYLSRSISEHYNMSFTQLVNSFRIKEAIRILSNPQDKTPLKAVGLMVGYSSPTSFYTHFKEATGMTPAIYRRTSSE